MDHQDGTGPGGEQTRDSAGVLVPPPLIYAAGFLGGWQLDRALPPSPWLPRTPRVAAGSVLVTAGALILGSAIRMMLRAKTTLNPAGPASTLVTGGPFRFTRNPIYLGDTLMYLGLALLFGRRGPLLLLPGVLAALDRGVIRREERYLERRFGRQYRAYRARVRRWL